MKLQHNLGAMAVLAFSLSNPSGALAQEDGAPVPTSLVESYKAWQVECDQVKVRAKKDDKKEGEGEADTETKQLCSAHQAYSNTTKNGKVEIARFFFYYTEDEETKKKKLISGVRTLVDISFDKEPELFADDKSIAKGKFIRCRASNCFISFELDDKKRKAMASGKKGHFEFKLSNNRNFRVNMSLDGLTSAFKSLDAKK